MGMPVTPEATPEVSSTSDNGNISNSSNISTSSEVAAHGDPKEVSSTNAVKTTAPESSSPLLTMNSAVGQQAGNALRPQLSSQSSLRQSERPNSAPPHEFERFSNALTEVIRREGHQGTHGHTWQMLGDQFAFETEIRRALSTGYLDRYQHDKTDR